LPRANVATPINAADFKVQKLGEECLRQAAVTKALGLRKAVAYDATKAAMASVPRWVLDYVVGGPLCKWPSWRAAGRNCADNQWDAEKRAWSANQERRYFTLEAKSQIQAEREMKALNRQFYSEWDAKWRAAGIPHNRNAIYEAWCREHAKLLRMVNMLAKLRATTQAALSMKAMVTAVARESFDDEVWCDKLQASLMADLAKTARGLPCCKS
jgi:hypothetical protein